MKATKKVIFISVQSFKSSLYALAEIQTFYGL
jgi:hypothetical protein